MFKMQADVGMFVYVYNLNDIEGYMALEGQNPLEGIYTAEPKFFSFAYTYLLNWLYFRFLEFRARNNTITSTGWPRPTRRPPGTGCVPSFRSCTASASRGMPTFAWSFFRSSTI